MKTNTLASQLSPEALPDGANKEPDPKCQCCHRKPYSMKTEDGRWVCSRCGREERLKLNAQDRHDLNDIKGALRDLGYFQALIRAGELGYKRLAGKLIVEAVKSDLREERSAEK